MRRYYCCANHFSFYNHNCSRTLAIVVHLASSTVRSVLVFRRCSTWRLVDTLSISHYLISNVLAITHHPSPITHHPSPITHHPSPITHHPSPITLSGWLLIISMLAQILCLAVNHWALAAPLSTVGMACTQPCQLWLIAALVLL